MIEAQEVRDMYGSSDHEDEETLNKEIGFKDDEDSLFEEEIMPHNLQ